MKYVTLALLLFAALFAHAQPNSSAPNPPARNATDVISIYSDAYTNISSVNYNPFWGQSGTVNIAFDPGNGNLAMAYTNFNYQGTGFEANPQNASAMEYIHVDVWTSNATVLKFTPIDNSGVGPTEVLVDIPLVPNGWSSIDLPKSAFTGMSWNSVIQLKFDAQAGVTPCDIYLDNIYFWKSGVNPASDATLSVLQVDGATVPGFVPSAYNYTFGVPGGGSTPQITQATTTNPLATVTAINQASGVPGQATVLVTAADGVTTATYTVSYFFNSPATGAPVPTSNNVISLFSDTYTNVLVDTWNTPWSQSGFEDDTIAGNPTKRYFNLGFNGIETTTAPVNASGMTYLHLDVWTPNITTLNVKLVSFLGDGFGGANGDSEANLNFTPTLSAWNQLHIPLADFTSAGLTSLNDLNQYILTSTPFGPGVLFLDNMYFTTDQLVDTDGPESVQRKVVVFPNPAATGTQVYITAEVAKVDVYNMNGQLIKTTTLPAISLQGFDKGMYLLKITDTDGVVHTDKLLVK
ncbi:MAG: T9SS type A sorting domain-containing protein [Saprospiraceae bacterium]|nr:T9SS type A sorting domain-containing protein [Saprospiraceae bacterium]